MSYILEALKKSEQERARERGALPDIKSVHAPSSTLHEENRRWWPIVLISVIVIAGASLTALYITRFQPVDDNVRPEKGESAPVTENKIIETPVVKPAGESNKKPEAVVSAKKNTTEKDATTVKEQKEQRVVFSTEQLQRDDAIGNIDEQNQRAAEEKVLQPSTTESESAKVEETTVAISDIPDAVRRKIPAISFEGHVYSSNPERRSVMINGHKRREGDTIGGELLLKAITTDGAEFEIQGYRFRLNALQDWSSR